jgi:hypothetical protein
MRRKILGTTVLIGVLLCSTRAAAESQSAPRSNKKRIVWTLVGAGVGYAAGLMWGLSKFDDAIDSDRKVHTSAILGGVAGTIAGGVLSGNIANTPLRAAYPERDRTVQTTRAGPVFSKGSDGYQTLRRRVSAANGW